MATTTNEKSSSKTTAPIKTFRDRGLSAAIFVNHGQSEGREVSFHKVSLQRTYKEGDEFKTTTSLGRDDLPRAAFLLQRAWAFIQDLEAAHRPCDEELAD